MPAPTVWAVLFFFMMLIIGFSSQVSTFVLESVLVIFNLHLKKSITILNLFGIVFVFISRELVVL